MDPRTNCMILASNMLVTWVRVTAHLKMASKYRCVRKHSTNLTDNNIYQADLFRKLYGKLGGGVFYGKANGFKYKLCRMTGQSGGHSLKQRDRWSPPDILNNPKLNIWAPNDNPCNRENVDKLGVERHWRLREKWSWRVWKSSAPNPLDLAFRNLYYN